jgi:hypothetical protein
MDSVKHYLTLIYDPLPIMYFMSIRKLDKGDIQIMDACRYHIWRFRRECLPITITDNPSPC